MLVYHAFSVSVSVSLLPELSTNPGTITCDPVVPVAIVALLDVYASVYVPALPDVPVSVATMTTFLLPNPVVACR